MKSRIDFIIPECYVDTNLVETLVCNGGCNHQKGCNQVAKIMQEKFSERFAVGIIDADKRQPGYLKEFHEITSSEHIKIFRHSLRPHYMILVCPAIDSFILSCAETAQINLEDYDLSPKLKEFTTQTKNVMSNKDARFKRLFHSMQGKGEIDLITKLINYFIKDTYGVTEERIRQLFIMNE